MRGTGARATGKVVVVMIVDACATCAFGDLDFTTRVGAGWTTGPVLAPPGCVKD